jgi:hypothetical protein
MWLEKNVISNSVDLIMTHYLGRTVNLVTGSTDDQHLTKTNQYIFLPSWPSHGVPASDD